jgi:hypothetical protein
LRAGLFLETGEAFRFFTHGFGAVMSGTPPPAGDWFVTWFDHDHV